MTKNLIALVAFLGLGLSAHADCIDELKAATKYSLDGYKRLTESGQLKALDYNESLDRQINTVKFGAITCKYQEGYSEERVQAIIDWIELSKIVF